MALFRPAFNKPEITFMYFWCIFVARWKRWTYLLLAGEMGSRKAQDVELDLGRYELRRGGRRVKLEKKSMELLIFLAGRREQLVSRKDIECRLWQAASLIDAERNINNLVRKIRRALGDDTAKPRFLETVIGKGYRFIGPMRVIGPLYPTKSLEEAKGVPPVMVQDVGWRAERPALAVLPLRVLGDAGHDNALSLAFADALTAAWATWKMWTCCRLRPWRM
jgi:DNA-binding winged helix-turn-helix (wHTH) protein